MTCRSHGCLSAPVPIVTDVTWPASLESYAPVRKTHQMAMEKESISCFLQVYLSLKQTHTHNILVLFKKTFSAAWLNWTSCHHHVTTAALSPRVWFVRDWPFKNHYQFGLYQQISFIGSGIDNFHWHESNNKNIPAKGIIKIQVLKQDKHLWSKQKCQMICAWFAEMK